MVNKVDVEKLEQHIGELNALYSEWNGYTKNVPDIGENSGRTVEQMTKISQSLQQLQSGFVGLLNSTICYMNQRKTSVETKENAAAKNISK